MNKIEHNGLTFFEFDNLAQQEDLRHGVFTRLGGVSKAPYDSLNAGLHVLDEAVDVVENREMIANALDFPLEALTTMQQVHSVTVSMVGPDEVGAGAMSYDEAYPETDALITNVPGALLMTLVADCTAVILYDPIRRVLGVVHGGWRGTLGRIGELTVEQMAYEYGSKPKDILAGISPSIKSCCYPVGKNIAELFKAEFPGVRGMVKGENLDVGKAMVAQLKDAGLRPESIELSDMCTSCRNDLFFSYRKEGTTGRFAVVAGIAE